MSTTTEKVAPRYTLPAPKKLGERRVFTVEHEDGRTGTVHSKAVTMTKWEVDRDDWFVFGAGWKYTGEVQP